MELDEAMRDFDGSPRERKVSTSDSLEKNWPRSLSLAPVRKVSADDTLGLGGVYGGSFLGAEAETCEDIDGVEKWPRTLGRHLEDMVAIEFLGDAQLPKPCTVDRLDDRL